MNRPRMTKAERDDLIRLIKQREKLARSAAEQRSAAMLAEFEQKITDLHPFDRNEVWTAAVEAVAEATEEANARIAAEAEKLGIPEEFRPSVRFHWDRRGEAEYRQRRDELRRVAKAEIDAIEKAAVVQIGTESVRAQTEVISHGLESEAAQQFLNSLPAVEDMMPALDLETIQRKLAERKRERGSNYLSLVD